MDNIEGLLHAKDIISLLLEGKEFDLRSVLRKPFFVPESAPMEKVLLQMQESAVHMAFVVDEFGSVEGIVTLEDIIEEIVGDIRDEQDETSEAWFQASADGDYLIKGSASVNEINRVLPLKIPEKQDYTTLAGFFLYEFGRIPKEKDSLEHEGRTFRRREDEQAPHQPHQGRTPAAGDGDAPMKTVATNKTAYHNYEILESFEAGVALLGSEVKSIRDGRVSLKESYAEVRGGDVVLVKCHISPYEAANIFNHEPLRERRLLLHKREIRRLIGQKIKERGFTLVPTKVLFNDRGKVKVEIALVRGRREYEKRDVIKKRDTDREIRAEIKKRSRDSPTDRPAHRSGPPLRLIGPARSARPDGWLPACCGDRRCPCRRCRRPVPWSGDVRTNGIPSVVLTPVSKAATLKPMSPWSWNRATTIFSGWSSALRNTVSGGKGPRTGMPSRSAAAMAGLISVSSSAPSKPSSPACGFNPATRSSSTPGRTADKLPVEGPEELQEDGLPDPARGPRPGEDDGSEGRPSGAPTRTS